MKYLWALLAVALWPACNERAPVPPMPDSEDVQAVQDSIREGILLRISLAQMEISRQTEMMRRRAYNADKKLADDLNRKIAVAERAAAELEAETALLLADSLPSNWLDIRQRTDRILEKAGRTLKTVL